MNEQFRQSPAEIQRRSMVENYIQQQLMAERARLEEMAAERDHNSSSERQRRTIEAQYIENFLREYPLMSSPSEQMIILRDFLNYIHNSQPEEIERKMAEKMEIDRLINAKRAHLEEMASERNFLSQSERQRRANQNEYLRSVFPLSLTGGNETSIQKLQILQETLQKAIGEKLKYKKEKREAEDKAQEQQNQKEIVEREMSEIKRKITEAQEKITLSDQSLSKVTTKIERLREQIREENQEGEQEMTGGSRKKRNTRNTRKKGKGCNKGKKQSSKNRKGCSRRRSKKSRK